MSEKKVVVAAIQMASKNGQTEHNLATASPLVAEAVQQGAQLILLPESFAIGYELTENVWNSAEPEGGRTEQWLCEMARQHHCYIGGSYLQASGEDFYNVFALATPNGEIAGRVSKHFAGYVEPLFFRGKASSHIIDTELGRIGVAICYDNCFRITAETLIASNADLLLMPMSIPSPQKRWYNSDANIALYNETYRNAASNYSTLLGIPTVMANKCGPWQTDMPGILLTENSWYQGQSEIGDSDGRSLKELDGKQAVIVAEVTLNPDRKSKAIPASSDQYGKWSGPVPTELKFLWLFEWFSKRCYVKNPRRKAAAIKAATIAHLEI